MGGLRHTAGSCGPLAIACVVGCFNEPETPAGGETAESSEASDSTSDSGGRDSATSSGGSTTEKTSASTSGTDASSDDSDTDPGADASCPEQIVLLFDENAKQAGVDDLPVPVFLSPSVIDYALTMQGGTDVHFTGADNRTPLAHEIDTWRFEDESLIWVNVPRIDEDQDRIHLCYGADAPAPAPPNEVWGDEFVAVWHFSQDVFGRDAALLDSTRNENHGSATSKTTSMPLIDSRLGEGIRFGNLAQWIEIAATPSLGVSEAITLELVVRPTSLEPAFQRVLTRPSSFSARIREDAYDGPSVVLVFAGAGSLTARVTAAASEDWLYISGTYDVTDGVFRACVDGGSCETLSIAPGTAIAETPGEPLEIGRHDSIVDEVRISSVRRTDAWVEAMARGIDGSLVTFVQG